MKRPLELSVGVVDLEEVVAATRYHKSMTAEDYPLLGMLRLRNDQGVVECTLEDLEKVKKALLGEQNVAFAPDDRKVLEGVAALLRHSQVRKLLGEEGALYWDQRLQEMAARSPR